MHDKGCRIRQQIEIELDAAQSTGERGTIEAIATFEGSLDQRGGNREGFGATRDVAEHQVDQPETSRRAPAALHQPLSDSVFDRFNPEILIGLPPWPWIALDVSSKHS